MVIVLAVALAPLRVAQRERVPDRGRDVGHVPWVDQDGSGAQGLGCAGEFGQNKNPCVVRLTRHKFVRHQVHAVAQRRHQAYVRDGVERRQFRECELAVEVVDWDVRQRAVPAVDAAHDLVHERPQPAILRHVGAGRDRNLDEEDLVAPLGVFLEKLFESEQLLRDALDHVQPVHAEHDLDERERRGRGLGTGTREGRHASPPSPPISTLRPA